MSDLIDRQQAIDAFNTNVDELVVAGKENADSVEKYLNRVIDKIKELPSAQPEIIRCKDCKYWDTTWQNDYAPNYHYCPMIDGTRRNDFYCAYAERREVTT